MCRYRTVGSVYSALLKTPGSTTVRKSRSASASAAGRSMGIMRVSGVDEAVATPPTPLAMAVERHVRWARGGGLVTLVVGMGGVALPVWWG